MNKIIFNILKKNNIDIAEDLYHYGWSIFVHYLFYLIITLSIAVYYLSNNYFLISIYSLT